MNNADRIRAMTDEELAFFVYKYSCPPDGEKKCFYDGVDTTDCYNCWFAWLKQEAEDERAD